MSTLADGIIKCFVWFPSELITKLGMNVLLPVFIAFLFFIMWDISKKNNAGKQRHFGSLALGGGFFGFLIKVLKLEWYFERTL